MTREYNETVIYKGRAIHVEIGFHSPIRGYWCLNGGDDTSGGLWFGPNLTLEDYDGCFELHPLVREALTTLGVPNVGDFS